MTIDVRGSQLEPSGLLVYRNILGQRFGVRTDPEKRMRYSIGTAEVLRWPITSLV